MGRFDEIRDHMEVVAWDGRHVGSVNHIEGNRVYLDNEDGKLAGADDGQSFFFRSKIAEVADGRVRLAPSATHVVRVEAEFGRRRMRD